MKNAEQRIVELGLELPALSKSMGSYLSTKRTGNILYISGQIPRVDGEIKFTGQIGKDIAIEEAQKAAHLTTLVILSVLKDALGTLDRVTQVIKMTGFVNAAPGFTQHPAIINTCSDLLEKVFGEKGLHARAAVGVASLPANVPVEIEGIFEVED